jgi:protein-L-isoaspartate O-methyltransferase
MKKVWDFVYRLRWSALIIAVALVAWWWAFQYLSDFRPPDVPFVTTPKDVVSAMLDLADVGESDVVYDLGSGDGRVLMAAARRGARSLGIEIDPELVTQSQEAVREAGLSRLITVRRGDIFKQDLRGATVITMYLKPLVNVQLRPQLDRLRPGTRIVSHMFSMPGAKPAKKVEVKSAETTLEHTLYLWVTPIEWE